MGFFFKRETRQEKKKNGPSMEKELAPGVLGQLWIASRDDGRKRIDWSIARVPRESGQLPYRTFPPRLLPAAVYSLARLAKGFSEQAELDSETRTKLAMLAAVLFDVLGDPTEDDVESREASDGNGAHPAPNVMDL